MSGIFFDVLKAVSEMKAADMPSAHRLVLLAIANHANAQNRAWPSLARLHEQTAYGRTKLAEVIADLVRFGWLKPDGREGVHFGGAARFEVTIGERWPADSRAPKARRFNGSGTRTADHSDPHGGSIRTAGQTDSPRGTNRSAVRIGDDANGAEGTAIRRAGTPDPPCEYPPIRRAVDTDPPCGHEPLRNFLFEPTDSRPLLNNQNGTLFAELDSPKTDPPKVKRKPPTKRPRNPEVPPVPLEALNKKERAVYDAIVTDPSLRPICLGPVQLAIDLTAIGSLIDVPAMVRRAGSWMRGDPRDPRRRKTNGNTYLAKWITNEQDRAAAIPRPAEPPGEERRKPPKTPGIPRDVLEGVERMNREGIVVDPAAALAKLELIGR